MKDFKRLITRPDVVMVVSFSAGLGAAVGRFAFQVLARGDGVFSHKPTPATAPANPVAKGAPQKPILMCGTSALVAAQHKDYLIQTSYGMSIKMKSFQRIINSGRPLSDRERAELSEALWTTEDLLKSALSDWL